MSTPRRVRRTLLGAWPLLLALGAGACADQEPAVGDADDIVAIAHPELWPRIQSRVKAKLEPSPIAIGAQKAFQVSYQDPTEQTWREQRRARQLLLIGTPTDPWMEEPLARLKGEAPTLPAIVEVDDVWAAGQHATLLLLPEGDARAAVTAQLDSLRTLYDQRYREWVVTRMFANGASRALADSVFEEAGFTVLVPADYEASRDGDVFLFRRSATDSSHVIRHVAVTWRSPIPQGMQGEGLLGWRSQLAATHYGVRQAAALANVEATQTTHRGNVVYQLLGNWQNPQRTAPTRGPFILRAEICTFQDRMYLVDAWLWAPDQEQHEYLVELESIVNSFRCGSARSNQPNE